MPTQRYVLDMGNGTIKVLYTKSELEYYKGYCVGIKKEIMTDSGWKEKEVLL